MKNAQSSSSADAAETPDLARYGITPELVAELREWWDPDESNIDSVARALYAQGNHDGFQMAYQMFRNLAAFRADVARQLAESMGLVGDIAVEPPICEREAKRGAPVVVHGTIVDPDAGSGVVVNIEHTGPRWFDHRAVELVQP